MSRYRLPCERMPPSPPSQAAPEGVKPQVQALPAEAIERLRRAVQARPEEEYVEVARQRALEVSRLAEICQGLRQRMIDSPLMGGRRYCAEVEAAYREMWRTWCRRQTTG